MTTKFYDRLSNDLTQLLENPIDHNVTIEIGEAPINQIFKVHSYILQSRSTYFKKKVDEISFNENHVKELKMPNISTNLFNVIIKYIYGGTISLEKLEISIIFDLLIASLELNLDELVEHLQTHLVTNNASCTYFKKKVDEISFNENHVKELKMPNISTNLFNVIIKYIYGGTISLEKLEISIIFDLLIASLELNLDELVEHLQTHLVTNNASWLKLNFAQVLQKSYHKNFEIIQNFCNNIISKHPNIIFESENFNSLPEDVLISIIKLDDLQLEEDKIWDFVIQWGRAKNPTFPTNLNEWTSDNFLTLKTTLKDCFPHIRYFNISSEKVVEKFYPYQQLFESKLWSDINIKFLAPNKPISSIILPPRKIISSTLPTRTTPFPSNIISNEHALEISSWIDRKEIPYTENNPYEFKLLVRGSRDGFDVRNIYEICDKVSNTVIVLKVEGTGEIIGGYNPLEIRNNIDDVYEHFYSEDSFVFSLKIENLKNSIISRVKNFEAAIYSYSSMESLDFGYALNLRDNLKTQKKSCCGTTHYEKLIRSNEDYFSVEEFEVFKISPKK
ncbi:hypothetical protein Glove_856g49 [Diversispora epigaea]|uniref:BTB domain-containing protein n=1 Tax=Diversispora epigaea TaxID=1348612 RepID=A0A397FZ22_9GLOM|nr:hypothetical protein Glove_856g49 [Diversispora epigaea]